MSEEPFQLGDYSQFGLAAAEAALFSAWGALEKFHEDLVVVGGLAVHYHTRDEKNSRFAFVARMTEPSAKLSANQYSSGSMMQVELRSCSVMM